MKRIIYIIFSAILLSGLSLTAQEPIATPTKLSYAKVAKERSKDGKMLTISYEVDVPKGAVKCQQAVLAFPRLVSRDGKQQIDLESFAVMGKVRYKSYSRNVALGNDTRMPLVSTVHKVPYKHLYTFQFPYEKWMAKSDFVVSEQIFGCAQCPKGELAGAINLPDIVTFSKDDYRYSFVEPKAVREKRLEEKFESKVTFPCAQSRLDAAFENNRDELKRLSDFVKKSLSYEGATMDKVVIEGFASPEGSAEGNKRLSENRSLALSNYVISKFPALRKVSNMSVNGFGEDWNGLVKVLKESRPSYAEAMLGIIDKYPNVQARKAALKSYDGCRPYIEMVRDYYPQLRRTTFTMGYAVRFFADQELERIFNNSPQLLSHHELYKLAQQRISKGKSPLEVYQKAYELYQDDRVAALNYANAILKYGKGNYAKVLEILEPYKEMREAMMPRAIALNETGRQQEAEQIFLELTQK
ncbi:DUF3868 domain-containing protein [Falsiporphyromonas endometrii]|uniref:DUF3868 domain-containing protein n=1 Tax=Falsiporphyromonas endometrii TaxID=1387297 RepID=A0ABV9K754_9PORP